MKKAVFLDRDGTINFDFGYVYKIEQFQFIPGSVQALKMLQDGGYLLIIITNQSGIARGYFSEEEYLRLERHIDQMLRKDGIRVTKTYYCPHVGTACNCRKPKTELFYRAAEEFHIDFSRSYAVGDKMRDLCICEKEPVEGILLSKEGQFHNLLEAANYICKI